MAFLVFRTALRKKFFASRVSLFSTYVTAFAISNAAMRIARSMRERSLIAASMLGKFTFSDANIA